MTLVWWPLQGCSGSPLGSHGDEIVSLLTAPKADERLRPSDGAPQVCSAAVRSARPASSQGRAGLPAHLRAPGREPAALRRVLLLGTRPGTCRCSVNPGEVDEYRRDRRVRCPRLHPGRRPAGRCELPTAVELFPSHTRATRANSFRSRNTPVGKTALFSHLSTTKAANSYYDMRVSARL